MKIRGWLILGPAKSSMGLPPSATQGMVRGELPQAGDYYPGTWILWAQNPDHEPIVLVCVEVPL